MGVCLCVCEYVCVCLCVCDYVHVSVCEGKRATFGPQGVNAQCRCSLHHPHHRRLCHLEEWETNTCLTKPRSAREREGEVEGLQEGKQHPKTNKVSKQKNTHKHQHTYTSINTHQQTCENIASTGPMARVCSCALHALAFWGAEAGSKRTLVITRGCIVVIASCSLWSIRRAADTTHARAWEMALADG